MNAADHAFMAGFHAALDLAERTGAAILAGQWGHPVRREHAAGSLLAFADVVREAFGNNVAAPDVATSQNVAAPDALTSLHAVADFAVASAIPAATDRREAARLRGYVGEACPDCANFTLVRNGTCLKCDTCGSTTGCS